MEPKPLEDTTNEVQMENSESTAAPAPAAAPATRKRPRLDLNSEPRERKRGKTMFGLLVGTLNKAKTEDKERSATDAVRSPLSLPSASPSHLDLSSHAVINVQAKKRQLIEQRLQDKLKKETDSVRRAEEAKKEKQIANRKEEELQLKDSIVRTSHLPSKMGCC